MPSDQTAGTLWSADHVAAIGPVAPYAAPLIGAADLAEALPELGLWDAWPIQNDDGSIHRFADGTGLWMALGAPWFENPDDRHAHARIHLLLRQASGWRSLGPAMPEGFAPGSREWSGSAIMDADGGGLTLYFTAAGTRGEAQPTFGQRLFQARARLAEDADAPRLTDWRDLRESVALDECLYMDPLSGGGGIGTIKAFRDPGFFRDPVTGEAWLFFTGSRAGSASAFNGVIGAARGAGGPDDPWQIVPPVISADGLNNELERPHVIHHAGHYYLFWSTQAHVFDPAGPVGPTGLYGMVSDRLEGEWRPLNGTGLVIANPPEAPRQAYSWLVLPDLRVTSFVDDWGHGADHAGTRRFGGTFAPFLTLALNGERARLRAAP
ncbi:glycoside hydrolase 68 family protein [Sphingobium sp. SYK-6]|uniref:glycoside hydrolase family 68 protein n=1 Tax=Sphingobium sp. (strain NBRC 103272 / SYK-6) TaxID=627192 RepID=UPI0002276BD4|nr:glycoside hydrolase family 68 protein [Sphingobium sp. SYK-6]BAK65492.1 glycoside hydrolase 68 family protein [Sphingobium sp. SYK-6]